jgi:hypothetical protein
MCIRDRRIINYLAFGSSIFIRYYKERSDILSEIPDYKSWNLYYLNNMAFGYFLHSIIHGLSPSSIEFNHHIWYPEGELVATDTIKFDEPSYEEIISSIIKSDDIEFHS